MDRVLPTALGKGQWQLYVLSSLYFITGAYSLFQLIYRRMNALRASFRTFFFLLCTCTMWYRSILVFFPFHFREHSTLVFLTTLLPLFLQFLTFSLLIIFLAKCVYTIYRNEREMYYRVYPVYGALVIILLILCIIMSVTYRPLEVENQRFFDRSLALYSAVVFGILTILVAIYGYKTYRVLVKVEGFYTYKKSVRGFVFVIILYTLVFIARVIWNMTYFFNINILQITFSNWSETNYSAYLSSYLGFYLIMEVIPTLAVVSTFQSVLPRRRSSAIEVNTEEQSHLLTQ